MGPDEQSTSKYGMIMTPINEDGTYGEPIKFGNLQPISDLQFIIDNTELSEEELNKLYPNEKIKPLLGTSWSGEFNVKFRHKKISKKTFKKWLMSHGFKRDLAELFCQIIASFGGRISYQSIYVDSFLVPTPHTLHHSITLEIHKLYEGAKNVWMKK